MPTNSSKEPLHVKINREMFSLFYTLTMDDGSSEELELEDMREWFRVRGADMDKMQEAFDTVWNFLNVEVVIASPKIPQGPKLPYAPDI